MLKTVSGAVGYIIDKKVKFDRGSGCRSESAVKRSASTKVLRGRNVNDLVSNFDRRHLMEKQALS